jgi:hypothetical protein
LAGKVGAREFVITGLLQFGISIPIGDES